MNFVRNLRLAGTVALLLQTQIFQDLGRRLRINILVLAQMLL
jgi:hypothetical protein